MVTLSIWYILRHTSCDFLSASLPFSPFPGHPLLCLSLPSAPHLMFLLWSFCFILLLLNFSVSSSLRICSTCRCFMFYRSSYLPFFTSAVRCTIDMCYTPIWTRIVPLSYWLYRNPRGNADKFCKPWNSRVPMVFIDRYRTLYVVNTSPRWYLWRQSVRCGLGKLVAQYVVRLVNSSVHWTCTGKNM
jgi:hypothetical protein